MTWYAFEDIDKAFEGLADSDKGEVTFTIAGPRWWSLKHAVQMMAVRADVVVKVDVDKHLFSQSILIKASGAVGGLRSFAAAIAELIRVNSKDED